MTFEEIFKNWTLEQKVEWALGPNICNLSNQMRSIIVDLKNENALLKDALKDKSQVYAEIEADHIERINTCTTTIRKLRDENALLRLADTDNTARFNALKEFFEELKKKVPKWISVKDRLPKEGTWCTVFHEGEIDSDHYTRFTFNKKCDFTLYGNKVTHWMPLPPPPTEEYSETEKENG